MKKGTTLNSSFEIRNSKFNPTSRNSILRLIEERKCLLIDFVVRLRHVDLPEGLPLLERDAAEAGELEDGEEDGDQLLAAASLQKPLQMDRRLLLHLLIQLGHLVGDFVDDALQLDRLRMRFLVSIERGAEGIDQIEQR